MHVPAGEFHTSHRCNRLGLRNLLGHQSLALEHIEEISVATNIELVGVQ
jgi:hypothetical protein